MQLNMAAPKQSGVIPNQGSEKPGFAILAVRVKELNESVGANIQRIGKFFVDFQSGSLEPKDF